ncbi:MAG TPA: prolyl oligopeptidase family serine peptidase [Candidatus Binataceae bacterium]|nr:prolyl oligopeptidase family serine peptidase [Candidatus Binataceae bacterium]
MSSLANFVGKAVLSITCVALIAADPSDKWKQPADCGAARKTLPPYSELVKAFRYDTRTPVAVDVLNNTPDANLMIQKIEFDVGGGLKCSGELIFPVRSGRYPGVVWLGSGDKDWERYAIEFSKLGAVSILPDWCGNASDIDAQAQYHDRVLLMINVRRAVDILSARKDVDRNRIAFVGHSGGTVLGADAVAVDKRFKAAVFEVGLQGFTYHICTSPYPFAVGVRRELKHRLLTYVSVLAPLDAILYVGHEAPTSLLFQSARFDEAIAPSDARAFFDAASEPKQLKWYDTGHKMNVPAVTKDRTEFLKKELGMN